MFLDEGPATEKAGDSMEVRQCQYGTMRRDGTELEQTNYANETKPVCVCVCLSGCNCSTAVTNG